MKRPDHTVILPPPDVGTPGSGAGEGDHSLTWRPVFLLLQVPPHVAPPAPASPPRSGKMTPLSIANPGA
jgi:hypothetical protein